MFGLFRILGAAFKIAFTQSNIKAGFRRAGMWPVKADAIINVPRVGTNGRDDTVLLSPDELQALVRARTEEVRNSILGAGLKIAACGYIDTAHGVVVNCKEALELAEKKRDLDAAKERAAEENRLQAELREAKEAKERREEKERTQQYMIARRARQAGKSVSEFSAGLRSMRERRVIAKGKAKARRSGVKAMHKNV